MARRNRDVQSNYTDGSLIINRYPFKLLVLYGYFIAMKVLSTMGDAVAEWSKALLERENKRKSQKDPRFAPRPGHLFFKSQVELT